MDYKRIHVRVPISYVAHLSGGRGASIKAQTIDISQGGVAVTVSGQPFTKSSYDIVIVTGDDRTIELSALLVRQTENVLGFKTTSIDEKSFRIITDYVHKYQETSDFIRQIEEYDLLSQRFVDEEGNELDVTFNVDLDKP